MNHFEKLNAVNVNDRTEKKGNLTYLSWAWAWGELMKVYPESTSRVYENAAGLNYHTDGKTAWVKCGVTVEGQEVIEYLPVMDNRNNSIPLERITSRNVNDAIQRCITKAIARHGLGLYIYAGEDLPEDDTARNEAPRAEPQGKEAVGPVCAECGKPITDVTWPDGSRTSARKMAEQTFGKYGKFLCGTCYTGLRANGNQGT